MVLKVRSADTYTSARSGEGMLLHLLYAFMTWTWKIYLYLKPLYVVATKYSWIHFISEKHKPAQPFKLLSLKNSPLVQLYISASDSKGLKTFLEANLQKTCQVCRRIRNVVSSTTKQLSFQCRFQCKEKVKISWIQVRRARGCCSVVTLFCAKKSLTETDRCAGAFS